MWTGIIIGFGACWFMLTVVGYLKNVYGIKKTAERLKKEGKRVDIDYVNLKLNVVGEESSEIKNRVGFRYPEIRG